MEMNLDTDARIQGFKISRNGVSKFLRFLLSTSRDIRSPSRSILLRLPAQLPFHSACYINYSHQSHNQSRNQSPPPWLTDDSEIYCFNHPQAITRPISSAVSQVRVCRTQIRTWLQVHCISAFCFILSGYTSSWKLGWWRGRSNLLVIWSWCSKHTGKSISGT